MLCSIQARSSCSSQEQHTNLLPSLNTRQISLAFVSGWTNLKLTKSKQSSQPMNPHKTTSNVSLGTPRFLALVNSTATFSSFCRSILERAVGTQCGQISIPIANPCGPTFCAAGNNDDPVPQPTSSSNPPGGITACSTSLTPKYSQ